jgi:hypothetical protein
MVCGETVAFMVILGFVVFIGVFARVGFLHGGESEGF